MRRSENWLRKQQASALLCTLLLLYPAASLMAQAPAETAPVADGTLLTADQLDNLVAPLALYPDSLLAQVLAASTYPLEIVEAQQWLQENRGLQNAQLLEAAKQQNWDPSIQALVAFPQVLAFLNKDIRWTTDLGNAFLAQQADVMTAIQRMRARARSNGRLTSTPQQTVTDNQGAIEIQPANPQVVYVPTYNPAYVWGAPAWGSYPALGYGWGFGFNPAVLLGSIFSAFLSFGGWGWGLNWLAHGLFLNNLFFGHFGFGGGFGGGYGGHSVWAHNPAHRQGLAYPRSVAGRFAGARNSTYSARSFNRGSVSRYNTPSRASSVASNRASRSVDGSRYNSPSRASSVASERGSRGVDSSRYSSPSRGSSFASDRGARNSASANRASRSYQQSSRSMQSSHASAPKAPKAPKMHSSGGHSSGGHSGKHK